MGKRRTVRKALASKRKYYVKKSLKEIMPHQTATKPLSKSSKIKISETETCSLSSNNNNSLKDVQITVFPERYASPEEEGMLNNSGQDLVGKDSHSSYPYNLNEAHILINHFEPSPSFILSNFLLDHSYCRPERDRTVAKNICSDVPLDHHKNDFETIEDLFKANETSSYTSELVSYDLDYFCEPSHSHDEVTEIDKFVVNAEPLIMTCEQKDTDFQDLCKRVAELPLIRSNKFILISTDTSLHIIQLYKNGTPSVKIAIEIDKDFHASIHVHRKKLDDKHFIWKGFPIKFLKQKNVEDLLRRIEGIHVCVGNQEPVFQGLVDNDGFLPKSGKEEAYREGDFGAVTSSGLRYSSTVRSTKCQLLLDQNDKCRYCLSYQYTMKARIRKLSYKANHRKDFNHTPYMSRLELLQKLELQKEEIYQLKVSVQILNKLCEKHKNAISNKNIDSTDENYNSSHSNLWSKPAISKQKMLFDHQNTNEDNDVNTGLKDMAKTDDNHQLAEPTKVIQFEAISKDVEKDFNTNRKIQQTKDANTLDEKGRIASSVNNNDSKLTKNPNEIIRNYIKTKSTWYPEKDVALDGNSKERGNSSEMGELNTGEYCEEEMLTLNKCEFTVIADESEREASKVKILPPGTTECADVSNSTKVYKLDNHGKPANYFEGMKGIECTIDSLVNTKTNKETSKSKNNRNNKHTTLCYICGKTYKHKASLQDHIADMHPDPDSAISCPQCPKVFYSRKRYKSHIRIHVVAKQNQVFSCELCDKTFPLKNTLNTHLKYMHSDGKTKPLECKQCKKTFKFPHSYREHIQAHTQSFKCDTCGLSLKSKRSLLRHIKRHSAVKPHNCEICGHGFIEKFSYWVHMEKHHDISRPGTSTKNKSRNEFGVKLNNILNSIPDDS